MPAERANGAERSFTSDRPRFSVQVPTYNAAKFLPASLLSLVHQTFKNWEAILVDDGSTDGSLDLAKEIVGEDDRFRFVRNEVNRGLAATRNIALQHSRGDLVAFLDADDLWSPGFLEAHDSAHSGNDRLVSYGNFYYLEAGTLPRVRWRGASEMPRGNLFSLLTRRNRFAQSAVVIPRRLLEEFDGYDESLAGSMDWDLWLRLSEREIPFRPVARPLAMYRLWSGNMTASRLKRVEAEHQVLVRGLGRAETVSRRKRYSLRIQEALGDIAIATARQSGSDERKIASALYHAWRLSPRRGRLLLSWIAMQLPAALGGGTLSRKVMDRVRRKW